MEDLLPDAMEAFFCSVSYALMRDPVSTSDGQTFERAAVEEWCVHCARSARTNAAVQCGGRVMHVCARSCKPHTHTHRE